MEASLLTPVSSALLSALHCTQYNTANLREVKGVTHLVALAQTLQDFKGLFDCGLRDHHRLEAAASNDDREKGKGEERNAGTMEGLEAAVGKDIKGKRIE